jgi:hypothetical protein
MTSETLQSASPPETLTSNAPSIADVSNHVSDVAGDSEWPTDPTLSYIEGPLDRRASREVEKQLARIPDLLTRYPMSNPDRLASIQRFEAQYADQVVHSVLQAPGQAPMWAWVAEAFAREGRAELAARKRARETATERHLGEGRSILRMDETGMRHWQRPATTNRKAQS